ncbi:hypothetical protein ACFLU6_14375 [Acidobacteriota bacterium]
MKDMDFFVQFDEPAEGFKTGTPYRVLAMDGRDVLLIDEKARFRWVPVEQCSPNTIIKGNETVFERTWYDSQKRNEALLGKLVLVKSLEEMGIPGEQRSDDGFFTFAGRLEGFERDLLTIVSEGEAPVVAKITHQQVYSMEEYKPA